jgi:hypothetical protein
MERKAKLIDSSYDHLNGKEVILTNKDVGDNGDFIWQTNLPHPESPESNLWVNESEVKFLDRMTHLERAVHWAEGLYTGEVLTEDTKEDIISEMEGIPDAQEAIDLLEEVEYVLNMIPNKKNVGRNGESSYDMAAKVGRFLKGHKEIYGEI